MLRNFLCSFFACYEGTFQSYYSRLLETSSLETAPTAAEARRDYLRRAYGQHLI